MTIVSLFVVTSASVCAASTDVRRFKVYNSLTFPIAGMGLLYHGCVPGGIGIGQSLMGLGVGLLLLLIPYSMRVIGAGDVKFFAAIGAWTGPRLLVPILLVGCLATGLWSAFILHREGGFRAIATNLWSIGRGVACTLSLRRIGGFSADDMYSILGQSNRKVRLVPFSAMLSVGVLAVVSSEVYFMLFTM